MNFSPNTVRVCVTQLSAFVAWCTLHRLERPKQVTKFALERYERHLASCKYAASPGRLAVCAQLSRIFAVRTLFKWLSRKRYKERVSPMRPVEHGDLSRLCFPDFPRVAAGSKTPVCRAHALHPALFNGERDEMHHQLAWYAKLLIHVQVREWLNLGLGPLNELNVERSRHGLFSKCLEAGF